MIYGELFNAIVRAGVNCTVFAYLLFAPLRTRFRYNYFKTSILATLLATITIAVTVFFLTSGWFFADYSTVGIVVWLVSAICIFRIAIKGSSFELLFVILVILNLYVNIATISKVILIAFGFSHHNALIYTLIRMVSLIVCAPFLWILLGKQYRRVIEFNMKFTFWRYIWVIPALLYMIFFTKILPDYWKHPINVDNIDIAFAVLWAITSYVVFYVTFLMLIQNYQVITAQQQAELISAQLKMQEVQYEKLLKNIENTARMRHDWRHHLLSINCFAQSGQLEDLRKYLKALNLAYMGDTETSLCQNHVADVILQYYAEIARSYGITITIAADVPKSFAIADTDICVIFGNLIENAVEACVRQSQGEKSILIKAEMNGNQLALLVKNTYQDQIIFRDNVYGSTKHDGVGIGLASVSRVVKNNFGTMKISFNQTHFKVSVLIRGCCKSLS